MEELSSQLATLGDLMTIIFPALPNTMSSGCGPVNGTWVDVSGSSSVAFLRKDGGVVVENDHRSVTHDCKLSPRVVTDHPS